MSDRTGVTLVIPAWNEAEAIGAVLDEVPRDLVDQVLVVVGGPSDPTAEKAIADILIKRCGTGGKRRRLKPYFKRKVEQYRETLDWEYCAIFAAQQG